MHGVYWVNLKFKDHNSIDTSLYTYLCIAICIAICISVDECILSGQNKGRYVSQKRALSPTCLVGTVWDIQTKIIRYSLSRKFDSGNE